MCLPKAAVASRRGEHACCRFASAEDRHRAAVELVGHGGVQLDMPGIL
jgi:hypothetical protein